jgi:sec-independent protein translocase protein TatB
LQRIPEIRPAKIAPLALVYQSAALYRDVPAGGIHGLRPCVLFVTVLRGQVSLPFMGTPLPIEYANLGMADSLILMVMALVVFGPRRLPQIGRQIGKLMYEFRKASNDFKFQMEEELRNAEEADRRKKEEERQRLLAATIPEQASVSADPPAPVNTIQSPYPGEGTYPPQYPPETPAATPQAEETTPRIMPPSVGETVAARKPSLSDPGEPSSENSAQTQLAFEPETTEKAVETSEPASVGVAKEDSPAAEALNKHG